MPGRCATHRVVQLAATEASTNIEGHQPSAEFLAHMQALVDGQLGAEEVRCRIIDAGGGWEEPGRRA